MKKKSINRRDFLKLSATAGVGALLFPKAVAAASTVLAQAGASADKKIPTRVLGRTGIEVPVLSMGVMRADNPSVVRAAYNSGIFHFDTAYGYQNGRNEELLGTFFEDKPRDSFFIGTKANMRVRDGFEEQFFEMVDTSLRRLKMKYVDIYYAHGLTRPEEVKNERIVAALKKVKEDGKARFLGFSTHAGRPDLLDAAVEAGIYDVVLLSYNFKLANLEETNAAIERAAKAGIGLVAMKTMTGGVADAQGQNKINAQACLKWVWENKNITTAIPGFSNYDELEACLAAAGNLTLTTDERSYLAELRGQEMLYCQQCRTCDGQCPENLPIPDLMRAYMYAYGYKNAQLSKETLAGLDMPSNACSKCGGECSVNCPSGFDVARKIAAITPVMNVPDEFLA